MKKILLGLVLLCSFSFAHADLVPSEGASNQYDGIWLLDSGQYITINYAHGQIVAIQLDDNLHEGQGREWVAYSGELNGEFATVSTLDEYSDNHAIFDIHFVDTNSLIGYFTECSGKAPNCDHSPFVSVNGSRVW